MQVGIDAKVIIPIGISSTRRSKSSHCAKCYTNQKQMLSLPQVSKDAKLELLKKICRRKVKQNFRRWVKKNFLIKEPLSSEEKQPQMPFSLQQRVKLSVLIIL